MSALVSELIEVDVFSLVREPVDAVTTIAASVSSVGAVAAGAAAARSLRHAEKRFGGLGSVARKLPYLSSGILALMALFIGIQGWLHLR